MARREWAVSAEGWCSLTMLTALARDRTHCKHGTRTRGLFRNNDYKKTGLVRLSMWCLAHRRHLNHPLAIVKISTISYDPRPSAAQSGGRFAPALPATPTDINILVNRSTRSPSEKGNTCWSGISRLEMTSTIFDQLRSGSIPREIRRPITICWRHCR